tara:strand:+ start:562 stop:681 length:120 start_codon:yes stop_codon:yes gene_type:complete
MRTLKQRANSLIRARDRARNPEWKELWQKKLMELLYPPV